MANDGEGADTWLARRETLKEKGYNGNGAGMPLAIAVQAPMERLGRCPCRCHTSMSSAAGSPAKTSASLAVAGVLRKDHVRVFGGSSQGSLGNFDPVTSSLRTSQLSLLEDSTSSLRILPRAGSMRSGIIFQRRPLAPLTAGTGSGLLHTPTAKANQLAPSMSGREPGSWATPKATDADRGGRGDLIQQVRGNKSPSGHYLPTPNARDWKDTGPSQGNRKSPSLGTVAHWPTPHGMPQPGAKRKPGPSGNELGRAVNEAEQRQWPTPKGSPSGPDYARAARDGSGGDDLATAVAREDGGSLNPTWVEWLMGYPGEWTALEPSGTASSRRSPSGSDAG